MTVSATQSEPAKVIYLVERRPSQTELSQHPLLEKIKHVAGAAIAFFGLALLAFAAFAFLGHMIGFLSITAFNFNVEMTFMIGLVATVAGFNLSTKASQAAEIYLGPLSVTV